jgi:hypothetical protein
MRFLVAFPAQAREEVRLIGGQQDGLVPEMRHDGLITRSAPLADVPIPLQHRTPNRVDARFVPRIQADVKEHSPEEKSGDLPPSAKHRKREQHLKAVEPARGKVMRRLGLSEEAHRCAWAYLPFMQAEPEIVITIQENACREWHQRRSPQAGIERDSA